MTITNLANKYEIEVDFNFSVSSNYGYIKCDTLMSEGWSYFESSCKTLLDFFVEKKK